MTEPIPFNVPFVAGAEGQYIDEVFQNRHFTGNGPFTKRVQRFLESRYGVPRVLLTHSCTAALEMAALLLDLEPEDEVIVPSYTFPSTASGFVRAGAQVVFCEIDPETLMLDPDDVADRIGPRTRAIVPVHYGGIACDMESLVKLAEEHDLVLVEDAAQGLNASVDHRWLGTIGALGCLSFHETKNLHCGLGGALFINDEAYAERAEKIWERGTNRQKMIRGSIDKYSWVELGSSFYPSELQAAFLLAQLESLDRNLVVRKVIYEAYESYLKPMADRGWLSLPRIDPGRRLNYHSFYVIFNSTGRCDEIRSHLKAAGISAYIGYVPLHSSPMGQRLGYLPEDLPVTEEYATRVLRLPFHTEMTVEDVERVAAEIERCMGQFR